MIQPLMSAQRIVPHFTPSKCQGPKARKLIAMPKQKMSLSRLIKKRKKLFSNYIMSVKPQE